MDQISYQSPCSSEYIQLYTHIHTHICDAKSILAFVQPCNSLSLMNFFLYAFPMVYLYPDTLYLESKVFCLFKLIQDHKIHKAKPCKILPMVQYYNGWFPLTTLENENKKRNFKMCLVWQKLATLKELVSQRNFFSKYLTN